MRVVVVMAAENQPTVSEKDIQVFPEINQERLDKFLESRKKEEGDFVGYNPPEKMPRKDEPGRAEYVSNFKFAYNLLIESGLDENEVKKMPLDDLFQLARQRHSKFAESRHSAVEEFDQEPNSVDVEKFEEVKVEVTKDDRKEWMKNIGYDLVRVVRPVFKLEKDLKTPRKDEDIQADYLELDKAKKRLGGIYGRIMALSRGAKDKDEAKKIRIGIEDACLIVGGERATGRNGMNLEKAETLLRALKIEIPEPRVEKRKLVDEPKAEQDESPQTQENYLEAMKGKIDQQKLEKLQKIELELPQPEKEVLKAVILLATKPELRESHKDFWEKKAKPILASLGMNVV